MTPLLCTGAEEVHDVELLDQDGDLVTTLRSSECFAGWLCENYKEFGMYPGVESMTYRVREEPPPPEPVDEEQTPAP